MEQRKDIAAIIPVAGLSSRMKDFKPLLPLGEKSILETSIHLFKQNDIKDIFVVTGHRSAELETHIAAMDATSVHNPDFHQGMFSSILAGVNRLKPDCRAFFLLPADIPAIRPYTIKEMLTAHKNGEKKIIYPLFEDKRGHPPLISTHCLNAIQNFTRAGGLRACLADFEAEAMDLQVCDRAIHMDADTPDDYEEVLKKYENISIPEPSECLCLLKNSPMTDERIMNHCVKVAETALKICACLNQSPHLFNVRLIEAAALLHDIARKAPNHAIKGAELLRDMGFPDVADIVMEHMDLKTTGNIPLNEKEIVYFADKLVVGNQLVMNFENRFKEKLNTLKANTRSVTAIKSRLKTACMIKGKIEKALKKGVTIDVIGQ